MLLDQHSLRFHTFQHIFCLLPPISVHLSYYITNIANHKLVYNCFSGENITWHLQMTCVFIINWHWHYLAWFTKRRKFEWGQCESVTYRWEGQSRTWPAWSLQPGAWRRWATAAQWCLETQTEKENMTRHIMTPSRSPLFEIHPRIHPWMLSVNVPMTATIHQQLPADAP